MTTFTDEQYQALSDEMRRSARAATPIVLEHLLLRVDDGWAPHRVVDVGCGPGWWAREFFDRYATEALGVDGPFGGQAIRDRNVPTCRYVEADLTGPFLATPGLKPIADPARWDLALCLEVAEHLPDDRAHSFATALRALAPVVVFSAAIPGQGGIGHVNEQWPDYWAAMFRKAGWCTSGDIRWQLWDEPDLAPYYAQNMFVAWEPTKLWGPSEPVRGVVHPGVWSHVTRRG